MRERRTDSSATNSASIRDLLSALSLAILEASISA